MPPMDDSTRTLLYTLLILVWIASLALRLSPGLRERFPQVAPYAHLIGWLALIALLALSFLT
jgi:hypothetical protein